MVFNYVKWPEQSVNDSAIGRLDESPSKGFYLIGKQTLNANPKPDLSWYRFTKMADPVPVHQCCCLSGCHHEWMVEVRLKILKCAFWRGWKDTSAGPTSRSGLRMLM